MCVLQMELRLFLTIQTTQSRLASAPSSFNEEHKWHRKWFSVDYKLPPSDSLLPLPSCSILNSPQWQCTASSIDDIHDVFHLSCEEARVTCMAACGREDDHHAGSSIENTYHWILNPESLDTFPASGEGSSFEDIHVFRNESNSIGELELGVTAFSTLLSRDRKKKGKRSAYKESEEAYEIPRQPEIRPIS
ncbi:hypothetical protein G7Y89_g4698 [Cudoniella acicularis]|uniref:Uncharacterized protein n=1 Tax=Cudoniella acicularis TaxID=354080 RepID=A0A8H4RQ83_9HELO|nr:hypothetical protein G7Y89_g4698 [Cudoniella acicularis]